ncbi:MAG: HAMP domain-containing histidine kinase [Bacteroidales bacterium]|jgi:two-component system phosphate regulon sensor histidine kinase PhoR|nr:HAMP domain-containing histidine kinase [Bacteroidales bacterium]
MKKRIILLIAVLLTTITSLLVAAIFQLYKDSETVKRDIFSKEVLNAGTEVVNRIDLVLKGDSIVIVTPVTNAHDTILFQKHAKKLILDPSRVHPIGVIRSTITYMRDNKIDTRYDTIYFDTTRYSSIVPYPMPWESDYDTYVTRQNIQRKVKTGTDDDLIEMDSNTVRLLNKDYLYRIIKEALLNQNISADFEFALYNAYTTEFVIPFKQIATETILQNSYIFTLKPSEKFLATHYIMLYFPMERLILFQRNSFISTLIVVFVSVFLLIFVFMLFTLYRQKKIADVKNDFINNMTHEFKTPLSTISLACDALMNEQLNSKKNNREAYISIISDEKERLKLMVNNILQLAQLKKGQLHLYLEPCNIHELITQICNNFTLLIKSNKGEIKHYLYAEHHTILVDRMHIQNVITNFIENGVKYTNDRPNIAIRTENNKKSLIISVTDCGIGISKKNLKYIFNDFFRVSTGNIHDQKGQGLGLVYVKKIIDLHGGTINVSSEVNKGTTFSIALPIKK